MPSFSDWYSRQFAAWNRTRRLSASPYLARTETNTARMATALASGVPNAPSTTNDVEQNVPEPPKEKRQETLFGPNIGIVSDGPPWAQSQDEKKSTFSDYLTPEIVRRWVETSKETIQPTTTLQALVNLKRPTLRLCPLQIHTSDNPSDDQANTGSRNIHTLEFEYDCDAPKCNITIQVIIPSNEVNPHGNSRPSGHRITVYESVFEGGFGRVLKFEDGATIDLGRFEHVAPHGAQVLDPDQSSHRMSKDLTTTEIPELPELSSHPSVTPSPTPDHPDNARKRRFTTLHFRRRSTNHSVSGPALAVVDSDAAVSTEARDREKDTHNDDGVRVVIQLVALDDFGKELSSSNRQSTYLHVVRLGSPASGSEDNRSWVVKVVKREATIGPHTFHLHEIYGLSSASAQPTVPAASPTAHTYPPTVPASEDEPSSECLVCLSSPREVVLLPCRHLVACKECAINMVEFGAGGAIMHAEEPTTITEPAETTETPVVNGSVPPAVAIGSDGVDTSAPTAAPGSGAINANSSVVEPTQVAVHGTSPVSPPSLAGSATPAPPAPIGAPTAPAPSNPRRRRRAKGWSCPVCRQPYTSLLRITTTPPAMEEGKEGKRISTSTIDHPLATAVHVAPGAATGPTPVLEPTPEEPVPPVPSRSLRPVFLRALSRRAPDPVPPV